MKDTYDINELIAEYLLIKPHHIILIGFMGTGKTTISKYLSSVLDLDEVDTDQLIVEKEGRAITDIFEQSGEVYFRDVESSVLAELEKCNPLIISCGGGAVLKKENVTIMKKSGCIVLLTATPKTIYERVKNSNNRPILNNNMNVEFIEELMKKRSESYQKAADIIISTDNKNSDMIVEEIIAKLIQFKK